MQVQSAIIGLNEKCEDSSFERLKNEAMKKFYLLSLFFITNGWVSAFQSAADSAEIIPVRKRSHFTVVTRVHTMGLFMYMGKVVNHNPAADIYFNYSTRNGWGISAFKVVDMNDVHSHNNFAFALVSKTFHLGRKLTVTPNIGAALEQQHAFADHGSDVIVMLTSNFQITKNLTIDHSALFNNLVFETVYSDWTNRFRLMYSKAHFDATGFLWHNNAVIDKANYTSTGVSIFYNRIPLGSRVWLGAGLTSLFTIQSSNIEKLPTQSGIQFTTSLTIK